MKFKRSTFINGGVCGLVYAIASFAVANAQTTETKPDPNADVPRYMGIYTAGTVDKIQYTPTCPEYVIEFDTAKVQVSEDKAYVEAQAARLPEIEKGIEKYQNCMVVNFGRDRDDFISRLRDYNLGVAAKEARISADITAAADKTYNQIVADIKKGKPSKDVEPVFTSKWKAPEGRYIGSITAGTIDKLTYTGSCPDYFVEITADDFNKTRTKDRYTALSDYVNAEPTRRKAHEKCRVDNAMSDYEALQVAMKASFDKSWAASVDKYDKKLSIIESVIETARKYTSGKPAVKAGAKPKAPAPKKKK